MLLCLPRKYRSEDDDRAPVDYSYVGSVAEGKRRQEGTPIHQTPDRATVRHRVAPGAGTDADIAAQDPAPDEPRGYESAKRLPRAGDGAANAARIVYPRPRDNAFATMPSYAPQAAPSLDDAAQAAGYAVKEPRARRDAAPDRAAPQAAPPADIPPEAVPDWLRIARQNNEYTGVERPRRTPAAQVAPDPTQPPPTDMLGRPIARRAPAPYQHATPLSAQEYAAAGYPEELISLHQQEEHASQTAYGVGRKRHGAQVAAPPPPRQASPRVLPTDTQDGPELAYAPQRRMDRPMPPAHAESYAPPATRRPERAPRPMPNPDMEPWQHGHPAEPYPMGDNTLRPRADGYREAPTYAPRQRQPVAPPDAVYWVDGVAYAQQEDAPGDPYAPAMGGYPPQDPTLRGMRSRPNPYQPDTDAQAAWGDAPPPEDEDAEKPKLQIPYLGIATFVAAMALVLLWILQSTFLRQTEDVFAARAAAQAQLATAHPYQYRELIEQEAAGNNLHPAFVAAIVLNESSFNPQAESSVGARGLMQMMPETAQWVFEKIGDTGDFSFDAMYDPATNVRYACWYLHYLSERFRGDPVLVAAAFHAGQSTVQNWLNDSRYSQDSQTISLEDMMDGPTKTYATRVTRAFAVYRRLYYEGGQPETGQGSATGAADAAQPGDAA